MAQGSAKRWPDDFGVARRSATRWLIDFGVARRSATRWLIDFGVAWRWASSFSDHSKLLNRQHSEFCDRSKSLNRQHFEICDRSKLLNRQHFEICDRSSLLKDQQSDPGRRLATVTVRIPDGLGRLVREMPDPNRFVTEALHRALQGAAEIEADPVHLDGYSEELDRNSREFREGFAFQNDRDS